MSARPDSVEVMTPDTAQRAVIAAEPSASGVVIGAPGTGKTRTLIERVVHLLDVEGLRPEQVLALTPNRQAATALRDRIGVRIGQATPGPLARSLGSFAFQLVRGAMVREGAEPPALLTGADQDRIIAELLAGDAEDGRIRWPDALSPSVRASKGFRSELRAFLAECTEIGVDAAELRASGNEVWVATAEFLVEYRMVLDALRSAHRDAADLLSEASTILHTADTNTLGPLAPLRVVLIDDAQELTRGGIAVVTALRSRGIAVHAFGDPDISSGSFRGASPELFAQLAGVLGDVHVLDGPHRQRPALTALTRTVTQAIGVSGRVEHRRAPVPVTAEEVEAGVATFVAPSPTRSSIASPASCASGTSPTASAGTGWRSSPTTPGRSPHSRPNSPPGRSRHEPPVCSARSAAKGSYATSSASCVWRSLRSKSARHPHSRRRCAPPSEGWTRSDCGDCVRASDTSNSSREDRRLHANCCAARWRILRTSR